VEIVFKKVNELIPYVNNTRTHSDEQVQQIASSIKEFGFTNAILLDEKNGVIAGHGRIMAAKLLNMDEVPTVTLTGLTEAQIKAYIIADNKLALNAGWDEELLKVEIEGLYAEGYNIDLLGFSGEELIDLDIDFDGNLSLELDEDKADDVPELVENPVIKRGDLIELGMNFQHRLLCGDSTSEEDVAKLMDGKKADMVFTDPPYGVSYEGGHNDKKRKQIENDALQGDNLTDLFYEALNNACKYTKDYAPFYIWYASGKSVETFKSFERLPLSVRAIVTWYKIKSGLGAFMSQYIPNYEPCIYAFKTGKSIHWYGPTNEKTVWELKRDQTNTLHPTQKPVELPERAISNSSKPKEIVLDLFGGSGSTLIGADTLTRYCMTMEFDPKYAQVIIQRYCDYTSIDTIKINGEEVSWTTYKEENS
jgi:DNA modification methylase